MKLEIVCEIAYKGRFYYLDKSNNVYSLNPGVSAPCSPVISYEVYNDSKYYDPVNDADVISNIYTLAGVKCPSD